MTAQILIADDSQSVLRGLRALLGAKPGWEICGDAVDGKEAVARASERSSESFKRVAFAFSPSIHCLEKFREAAANSSSDARRS